MIFEENIHTTTGILKILGIGKVSVMLEKHLTNIEIPILSHTPIESSFWNGTDVGFIVACDTEENAWENLKNEINIAREHNVIIFPIFISENTPDVTDNIILLNPKHFLNEIDIYSYIGYSIKSIQLLISQPGCVNSNLEDLRALFKGNGRVAFEYYKSNKGRYRAAQNALQMKAIVGAPVIDAKIFILNIVTHENNISEMDLFDFIETIHSKINDDCTLIWNAISDEALTDKLHIYSWFKF